MDRRQSNYESYRPARDDRSGYRHPSRPDPPSRTNSRGFHNLSRRFESPSDVSSHSPHSPQRDQGPIENTMNTVSSDVSKDPRKGRDLPSTASDPNKVAGASATNTLLDYVREFTIQCSIEDKAREAEKTVRFAQGEEQKYKTAFPKGQEIIEIVTSKRKEAERVHSDLTRQVKESGDRLESILRTLPAELKTILFGSSDAPKQIQTSELTDLRSNLKSLSEEVGLLRRQKDQQDEKLKEQASTINSLSKNLDENVNSAISTAKRDSDTQCASLIQRIQKNEEHYKTSQENLQKQEQRLQFQKSEINGLSSKQTASEYSTKSLLQRIEQIEARATQDPASETARPPPTDHLEEDIARIRKQQEETKRQMANLSNLFVSSKDYQEDRGQSTMLVKKIQENNQRDKEELSSKVTDLTGRVDGLSTQAGKENADTESFSLEKQQRMQEQLDRLSKTQDELREEISQLNTRLLKHSEAQVIDTSGASNVPPDSGELTSLENKVKKLEGFSAHYQAFYEKTNEGLNDLNKQFTQLNDKVTNVQTAHNDSVLRTDSNERNEKIIRKFVTDSLSKQEGVNRQHLQLVTNLRTQATSWEADLKQGNELLRTQMAAMATELNNLKVRYDQVSHSMQSLDTKYSAMSTKQLYNAVVATMAPVVLQIPGIVDTVKALRSSSILHEQQMAGMRADLENLTQEIKSSTGNSVTKEVFANEMEKLREEKQPAQQAEVPPEPSSRAHDLNIQEVSAKIESFETSFRDMNRTLETLQTDVAVVEDLQSRVQTAQTEITTHQMLLEEIEKSLSYLTQSIEAKTETKTDDKEMDVDERLSSLQTELEALRTANGSIIKQEDDLRERIERLERELNHLLPSERYVICENLASTINAEYIQEVFRDCDIKNIRILGAVKTENTPGSRYALLRIAPLNNVDEIIDQIIGQQDGRKWTGRTVTIRRVERDLFEKIWREEPESIREMVRNLLKSAPASATVVTTRRSPSLISATPLSTPRLEVPGDTIEVARSSVLPRRSFASGDTSEILESEDDMLKQFGATRDGRHPDPLQSKVMRQLGSAKSVTPSGKAGMKRSAREMSSSVASTKSTKKTRL